jgi:hypothetical protein
LIKTEFPRFLHAIVLLPAQIVRTGRRVIYRIMSYNGWLKDPQKNTPTGGVNKRRPMSPYCHNPAPGTTPNAKIRIRTTYAAAPCGSVAKSLAKMSKNAAHATLGTLRVGFSLILGLV